MEFGVILGPVYPPRDEMSSRAAFELEMQFCAHAAAVGFEGVAVNHHFPVGPEAQCFQPIPMCGHILARYPELYVATTVLILSYHDPVEIPEQVAILDVMAPGRLLAPNLFEPYDDEGHSRPRLDSIPSDGLDLAQRAVQACLEGAISIVETDVPLPQ
jgi:ferredoxin